MKASKTDLFHQGVSVHIGQVAGELDPVVAILDHMVCPGTSSGPFFWFQDGRPLMTERSLKTVQTPAGTDVMLDTASALGWATMAVQRGVQDSLIKKLGCWESSVY